MKRSVLTLAVLALVLAACPVVLAQVELPEVFGTEIPIYPEGKVLDVKETGDGGTQVIIVVKDKSEQVSAFYKKEMTAKGWTVGQDYSDADHSVLVLEKGDSYGLMVDAAGHGGDRTMVSLIYAEKQ